MKPALKKIFTEYHKFHDKYIETGSERSRVAAHKRVEQLLIEIKKQKKV